MRHFKDHLGRSVTVSYPPKRIISLVPAITETMYHLGLEKEIVGRTRFCIHPKSKVKRVKNVGGTKDIKLERILERKPDLIIAEKEENTKEIVETLEQYVPVFVFEIQSVSDAYRMITDVGKLTNRQIEASNLTDQIEKQFQKLPHSLQKRVAYVIWKKPYMVVGKDTYIQSMLEKMGFLNPFTSFKGRYPSVTEDDLREANLDYIFLATEPYPFRQNHIKEFQQMLPGTIPFVIDGEMFWYGAKMVKATEYFLEKFQD